MAAGCAVIPFPATKRTATETHIALKPDCPGNINAVTGYRCITPDLISLFEKTFAVKCGLDALHELLEQNSVLTDIIECNKPVVNIVNNLAVALPFVKNTAPPPK